jgi:hypothetical protein
MNCLFCGQKLSGTQDPGLGSFCSADHKRKYGVDIRVLLQLQNPGRLEIPQPESTASSNCLYCSQPLSIRKRLKGWQFCNSEHEDLYYRLWNEQAIARLGGAAALEEDLYGVDLTEGDPQAIPRCQFCDEPLSVGRRLKRRRFCSEEHEEQYRQQQSSLIFSRLRADDRPRARPRRLWDPRNTEGCAGFEPMPVAPKPGRLTLYPAEGIQFSVSPSILRFGGEILKLASGGAVARPRLRSLVLGRRDPAMAPKAELNVAAPPGAAVICRVGEPGAEPPAKMIVLPGSAGCAAIREDLPEETFVAPELLRPPRDAGFLDYARTQIPERFRRPLWMPRMAVISLGRGVEGKPEWQEEAASQESAMEPPAPAGPLAEEQRWEGVSSPPALASGGTWIGAASSLLLPSVAGAFGHGERLAGSECSKLRIVAKIAGQRVPGWIAGDSGRVNLPRQQRETARFAGAVGRPLAVSGSAVDRVPAGTAERGWAITKAAEEVLPVPEKIPAGERLMTAAQCGAASAKDCRRAAQWQEAFLALGSREAIFPRMEAVLFEVGVGAAGFREVGRTREFSNLPRGTADGFLAVAAAVAVPKIAARQDRELMRSGGYRNPLPAGPLPARRADAIEWKQEPASILVRRAAPWKAPVGIGSGGLAGLACAARSGRRHEPQGQMWHAGNLQPVYPLWPQVPWEGKPAAREHLTVTPAVRGGLTTSTSGAQSGWRGEPRSEMWQAGTVSQPVYPPRPQVSFAGKPAPRVHLTVTPAARGLGMEWAGNRQWDAWSGVSGPVLPGAVDSQPAAAGLGNGRLRPVGTSPMGLPWVVTGESRLAGTGLVEMPKPPVGGGERPLWRMGDRVGEWSAKAGVRAAKGGEWRDRSLPDPRLPKPEAKGSLTGMRPSPAAGLGWRAGLHENGEFARELVIAYRFVFPAAAATELELLPPSRRLGARGKIVVLR